MEWQKFHSVEVDGANFCVKYCVLKKYYDLMNFENSHIKTVNYTPGGIKLVGLVATIENADSYLA